MTTPGNSRAGARIRSVGDTNCNHNVDVARQAGGQGGHPAHVLQPVGRGKAELAAQLAAPHHVAVDQTQPPGPIRPDAPPARGRSWSFPNKAYR